MMQSFVCWKFTAKRNNMDIQRNIVIGDLHGCIKHLEALIKKISYDPNKDRLIFVGDYVDRGPENLKTLDALLALKNDINVFLLGNHEDMLLKALFEPSMIDMPVIYLQNGGHKTFEEIIGPSADTLSLMSGRHNNLSIRVINRVLDKLDQKYIDFLKDLKLYFHDKELDLFCCHAGVDYRFAPDKQIPDDLLWIREKFLHSRRNGIEFPKVVFGHTPIKYIDQEKLYERHDGKAIPVDFGCFFSGELVSYIVEEDEYVGIKI